MTYIDGFVIVVKKGKLDDYRKMAQWGKGMWMKHGALEYFECVGDDLNPSMGGMKMLGFSKMSKAKPGEKVVFSFIVYKNKKHRDDVNKKVMAEMSSENHQEKWKDKPMPFDMKNMAWGGFKAIVEGRKR